MIRASGQKNVFYPAPRRRVCLAFLALVLLAGLAGCDKLTPSKGITLSQAHKKFKEICQNKYNMDVKIWPVGPKNSQTLWIYAPLKSSLFGYTATRRNLQPPQLALKPRLNFVDVTYQDRTATASRAFVVDYDIDEARQYAKDPGYKSSMNNKYSEAYIQIFGAIMDSYLEVKGADKNRDKEMGGQEPKFGLTTPETIRSPEPEQDNAPPPEFFVLVFADVVDGLAAQMTFSLKDYEGYVSQTIPQEEFTKRTITEFYGDKSVVDDTKGRHLKIKAMTWPEFMAKAIKTRVEFKYQKSMFPPSKDAVQEIKFLVAETLQFYDYTDYDDVVLNDLKEQSSLTFSRNTIEDVDIRSGQLQTVPVDMKEYLGQ